jgi:hypothetical protein
MCRSTHLLLASIAANVQEVCGAATTQLDDVHGSHGQACSIDHAADRTIKPNVVQVKLVSSNLPARKPGSNVAWIVSSGAEQRCMPMTVAPCDAVMTAQSLHGMTHTVECARIVQSQQEHIASHQTRKPYTVHHTAAPGAEVALVPHSTQHAQQL